MAYIATPPSTNGISWQRTPSFGNSEAKTLVIGPTSSSGGTVPSTGLIWWPKK